MSLSFSRNSLAVALAWVTGFSALLSATSANAAFVQIPQPDAAYTSSTTLLPITGNDLDTTTTLSDANLTLTFSALMQVFTDWGSWGAPPATEGNTPVPPVLSPFDFQNVFSVTMTFSKGLTTFGLEAEPDAVTQGPFPMKLDFFNGAMLLGTVSYGSVSGEGGAVLFAASSMTPITSATLTVEGNANVPEGVDFGAARFRYTLAPTSSVPESGSSIGLMLIALLATFSIHRWRLRTTQV